MDNELKWFLMFIIAFPILSAINSGIDKYVEHSETKFAMENGYEQVETTSGNLAWKKTENIKEKS